MRWQGCPPSTLHPIAPCMCPPQRWCWQPPPAPSHCPSTSQAQPPSCQPPCRTAQHSMSCHSTSCHTLHHKADQHRASLPAGQHSTAQHSTPQHGHSTPQHGHSTPQHITPHSLRFTAGRHRCQQQDAPLTEPKPSMQQCDALYLLRSCEAWCARAVQQCSVLRLDAMAVLTQQHRQSVVQPYHVSAMHLSYCGTSWA